MNYQEDTLGEACPLFMALRKQKLSVFSQVFLG